MGGGYGGYGGGATLCPLSSEVGWRSPQGRLEAVVGPQGRSPPPPSTPGRRAKAGKLCAAPPEGGAGEDVGSYTLRLRLSGQYFCG